MTAAIKSVAANAPFDVTRQRPGDENCRIDAAPERLLLAKVGPPAHRAGRLLSREHLDDGLCDRVGVLVEHEVAAVEIAQHGCRDNPLDDFRCRRQNKRVISPPDDERARPPVLQIGVPFRIVLDIRS